MNTSNEAKKIPFAKTKYICKNTFTRWEFTEWKFDKVGIHPMGTIGIHLRAIHRFGLPRIIS